MLSAFSAACSSSAVCPSLWRYLHREIRILVRSDYMRDNGHGQAVVTIEDEGPGIPEKQVEAIFKPFVTTKSKGTGLGLTMVSRIVDAHGGSIRVGNRTPCGASFAVGLPA